MPPSTMYFGILHTVIHPQPYLRTTVSHQLHNSMNRNDVSNLRVTSLKRKEPLDLYLSPLTDVKCRCGACVQARPCIWSRLPAGEGAAGQRRPGPLGDLRNRATFMFPNSVLCGKNLHLLGSCIFFDLL